MAKRRGHPREGRRLDQRHRQHPPVPDPGRRHQDLVREALRRLIAVSPYSEDSGDPDLVGGPGSRWARRHLYRLGDDSAIPPEVTAFTVWIDTPRTRWRLTWSRDHHQEGRILIHSLVREPES